MQDSTKAQVIIFNRLQKREQSTEIAGFGAASLANPLNIEPKLKKKFVLTH
jgi:hypothetical protein